MISIKKYLLLSILIILSASAYPQSTVNKMAVPLGGNSWGTVKAINGKERVTGEWNPIHKMFLDADATAGKKIRMDYDGGVENGKFFMRNWVFFNESAILKKIISVEAPVNRPVSNMDIPLEFLKKNATGIF